MGFLSDPNKPIFGSPPNRVEIEKQDEISAELNKLSLEYYGDVNDSTELISKLSRVAEFVEYIESNHPKVIKDFINERT